MFKNISTYFPQRYRFIHQCILISLLHSCYDFVLLSKRTFERGVGCSKWIIPYENLTPFLHRCHILYKVWFWSCQRNQNTMFNRTTYLSNLKRGGTKSFTLSWGGTQKVSDPQFSHFVAPLPIINDQSLGVLLVIIGQLESGCLCNHPLPSSLALERHWGMTVWPETFYSTKTDHSFFWSLTCKTE